MAFLGSKNGKDKAATCPEGTPYMYGTGDNTTTMSEYTTVYAQTPQHQDNFGKSVAVCNGRIYIAQDMIESSVPTGKVHGFNLDGTNVSTIASPSETFAEKVVAGNNRIVITAPGGGSSKVYIYDTQLNSIETLTPPSGQGVSGYGEDAAVGNNRVIVGAPYSTQNGANSGAVLMYDINGEFLRKIVASNASTNHRFGSSVAVGNGRIVVGASAGNVSTGPSVGAMYLFNLAGEEIDNDTPQAAVTGSLYGSAVAVGDGVIVVGQPQYTGTNAHGRAYIYNTPNAITAFEVKDWESGD